MAIRKSDFESLADMRIREAKILLDAGEYDGAYYLAGYAVECGIKVCIIKKLMTSDSWPEKRFSDNCYSHELKVLLRLADLEGELSRAGPVLARWGTIKEWTEQSRYEHGKAPTRVQQFYEAITDTTEGVLPWLKTHW